MMPRYPRGKGLEGEQVCGGGEEGGRGPGEDHGWKKASGSVGFFSEKS